MKYSFEKPTITKQSLEEQLKALKEKLWQSERAYADTVIPADSIYEPKGYNDGLDDNTQVSSSDSS